MLCVYKKQSFVSNTSPYHGADLCFPSPHPETGLHGHAMAAGLVLHSVPTFSLILCAFPPRIAILSWLKWSYSRFDWLPQLCCLGNYWNRPHSTLRLSTKGWPGWVDLGGRLRTGVVYPFYRWLPIPILTGPDTSLQTVDHSLSITPPSHHLWIWTCTCCIKDSNCL